MITAAAAAAPGRVLREPVRRGPVARIAPPVLLALVAASIAGAHVDRPALWRDEAASVTMAQRDWPAFFATVAHVDAVHAVYDALLHLWFSVVPYSPLALRLPSVLATAVTAALLTLLATRLAGVRAGIAAGAAGAVLPTLVWAGGEGRSYALTAMLATGSSLALVVALDAPRGRRALHWIGYSALLALGMALFLDSALLAAAHAATLLLVGRGRRIPGLAAIAAAGTAVSPLLLLAAHQTGQVAWITAYGSPPLWTDGIVQQWFRSGTVAVAWGVALVGGLLVAAIRRRLPGRVLALALPWAVLPPVTLVAVGLVHAPLYWPRYVTFTAPAIALLAGVLLASLPLPVTAGALLVLAVVAVPQVRADRAPRAKADSEMQLGAQLVARSRTATDGPAGIVFGQYDGIAGMTTRVEAIAYPGSFGGLTDLTAAVPLQRSTELFGQDVSTEAAVPRMARLRTVWILLDMHSTPKTHVPVASMRRLGFHQTGTFRTDGSMLLRFTR
jgi:mannosyltransferase